MRALLIALAAACLLAGCDDEHGDAPRSADVSPHGPTDAPADMVLTPASATPGQPVEVTYLEPTLRGIAFSLDLWQQNTWDRAYYLTSGQGRP